MGSVVLFLLFASFIYQCLKISENTSDRLGSIITFCVASLVFPSSPINILMAINFAPWWHSLALHQLRRLGLNIHPHRRRPSAQREHEKYTCFELKVCSSERTPTEPIPSRRHFPGSLRAFFWLPDRVGPPSGRVFSNPCPLFCR